MTEAVINVGDDVLIVQRNQLGMFACEGEECSSGFAWKSGFRLHLLTKSPKCLETMLSLHKKSPSPSFHSTAATAPSTWRPYNEAVLHASDETQTTEANQAKILYYTDKIGRLPIGFSTDGTEQNALVSKDVYDSLPDGPFLAIMNKSAVDKNKP
ncbi:hypothetical protein BGX34_007774, partial [Mortierella sp. NVP85]